MRNFIDIIEGISDQAQSGWSLLREIALTEVAPTGKKAEDFIKHSKADFKKRYGKKWKQVLYATAWKKFSESVVDKSVNLNEGQHYGYWITAEGNVLPVSRFDHEEVANNWLEDNLNIKTMSGWSYCLRNLGWIRVVSEGNRLCIQFLENSISKDAMIAAKDLIDGETIDRPIIISIMDPNFGEYDKTEFQPFEKSKAIQLIRQNVKQRTHQPLAA